MTDDRDRMVPIGEVLPIVLDDLGLHDLATKMRRQNMRPINGGQADEIEADKGMVVTNLEQTPEEAA